ncbi:hypothetical protein BFS14_22260 [Serratia fonticola]|nr:hypothetical protein BFS14_22260 [Serratia fonticola]
MPLSLHNPEKYLSNLVEQDHQNIKRPIQSMLGFKSFRRAQAHLAVIELIHIIRSCNLESLPGIFSSPLYRR